jgi:hypothetical protein
VNQPGPNDLVEVRAGAWLGLLSAALMLYGGYLSMRDEGTSLADTRLLARRARAAVEGAGRPGGESGSSEPPPSAPPPGA